MKTEIKLSILLSCAWFVIAGCNDDDTENMPTAQIVSLANDTALGSYLTDGEGLTLYFFARDADGNSACSGTCLDNWPIFYEPETSLEVGQGLDISDFDTITRNDGSMQTTYKGWPLYYFAQDQEAGDIAGEGVNNLWFVAKPDYTVMLARQTLEEGQDPMIYFTNAYGITLYRFTNDEEGVSNCTGNCINVWPVFPATEELVVPSTIDMADFSTVARTDGESGHWAYQSMPLYYFANDGNRGSTLGESVNGVWFVVQP